MPKIHTHIHLGVLLSQKIKIENLESFLLGNAYPDCWKEDEILAMMLHYKDDVNEQCDFNKFLSNEPKDDFHFGYYFHLWVDHYMKCVDVQDITYYDCLICDMEEILSYLTDMNQQGLSQKEKIAMNHMRELERQSMPLYLVSDEKKERYLKLLDWIVDRFIKEMEFVVYK